MTSPENATRTIADPVQDVVLTPAAPAQPVTSRSQALEADFAVPPDDLIAADTSVRTRRRAHRGLGRLLRAGRVSGRRVMSALVAEDAHIGPGRGLAGATHGETVVRGRAKGNADAVLARSQRRLDRHASRTDRLRAKHSRLLTRAELAGESRVRHPDGGHRTVGEVRRDEASQRGQIEDEMSRGSRKHQRLPGWLRHVPKAVLAVDFGLLLYFFSGISDVDWASPLSANLVFALLLAIMVTVLSYGFLAFAGHRMRSYKDHTGAVRLHELDALTAIAVAGAIIAIAVLATLMFLRMRTEVLYALGPRSVATAFAIGLAIAVVSALANFLVVAVHALDGSDQAARLEALSAAANRSATRAHRLRVRAAVIPPRVAVRRRRAERAAVQAIARAGRPLVAADQAIAAARAIHQNAGPNAGAVADPNQHEGVVGYRDPQAGPRPDLRPMRTTLDHLDTDLD